MASDQLPVLVVVHQTGTSRIVAGDQPLPSDANDRPGVDPDESAFDRPDVDAFGAAFVAHAISLGAGNDAGVDIGELQILGERNIRSLAADRGRSVCLDGVLVGFDA